MLVLDNYYNYDDLEFVELTESESVELEGGILPFLLAAGCLYLLSSCKMEIKITVNCQLGGKNNTICNHVDSTSHR
jgi:hypothetical protein